MQDKDWAESARKKWDSVAKPLDSLGIFEKQIIQIAGIKGDSDVKLHPASLFIFCADNGICAEGISQTDSIVTAEVAKSMAGGGSSACRMAKKAGCLVNVIDVGIEHDDILTGVPKRSEDYVDTATGLIEKKIRKGTENFLKAPAMSEDELNQAIDCGKEIARTAAYQGIEIFLTGEMGIGNTTTSAALASALLGVSPDVTVGRGAGLDNAGLNRKREAVKKGLKKYGFDLSEPVYSKEEVKRLMQCLGGLDIAAIEGFIIGAHKAHIPVIIDGVITAVAALCAVRMCPESRECIIGSHIGKEPSMKMIMDEMNISAPISAELALGEGTGALMELSLLDMALSVYNEGADFNDISVKPYKRFE
mgnify:CR=1 FL=1